MRFILRRAFHPRNLVQSLILYRELLIHSI